MVFLCIVIYNYITVSNTEYFKKIIIMIKKYNSKHASYARKKKYKKLKKVLAQYKDENGKQKESSIERKVRELLERLGIHFVQEKFLQWKKKWKSYDFFLTDGVSYSILLECDGSYWHNPDGQSKLQKKNIKNDKFKDELAIAFGIPLLRLKEKDIKTRPNEIEKIITEEIERQQRLNKILG